MSRHALRRLRLGLVAIDELADHNGVRQAVGGRGDGRASRARAVCGPREADDRLALGRHRSTPSSVITEVETEA